MIAPEQVELHVEHPTISALVDRWGRPHRLEVQTAVGRKVGAHGLAIFDSSVSRHHATVWLHEGVWSVRDLKSANGTFVEGRVVDQPVPLHDGDQVRFGELGFYFLADISRLPPAIPSLMSSETIRPMDFGSTRQLFEPVRRTPLPVVTFELHEPTGGGGGLVDIDSKRVQLTIPQLELVTVLVERMLGEADQPEPVRGFVASSELMKRLSWDAPDPADDHVRQLVRRVRRLLVKAGIEDLIESRHGLGYRLRATPRVKPPAR